MQKLFFLSVLMLTTVVSGLRAQDCPRIFQRGDTLYTDPAPQYQWFRDNNPINGANKQWYLPASKGNFSVAISATTLSVNINPTNPTLERVIAGRIVDERYEPIANASISVGQFNTKSDATGAFRLENIKILTENAVVTITKAGFWKNVQHVHFFDPNFAPLTAMLEPLRITNRFDAQKGATISERGFFLTFPPNSAVTEGGKTYQGTIALSLKRSFPSEDGFGLRMPGGDFSAIDANGQEKMLVSYGFMSAEMQGANGEKLRLAPDTDATLEFYIPWEQNKTAPDSMPLWHFDEANAVWKPEGIARKVGPRYVGTVKHFSSWNCDVPRNRATVKGKTRNCKGNPIPMLTVNVGQRVATTDQSGSYISFAPSETKFDVTASKDTVIVTPLGEGEERQVKDLEGIAGLDAVGLIDSAGVLTVYGAGVVSYSVDGGNSYHPKNTKLTFIEDYPLEGIAKDIDGCESKFRILILPKSGDCQLLDKVTLAQKQTYWDIASALLAKEHVYRLVLSKPSLAEIEKTISFYCLNELTLTRVLLNKLPSSIGGLINLKSLILGISDLTSLPESIGQLTNLESLIIGDMMLLSHLTTLPESIGYLTNLFSINIFNGRMTSLPGSIGLLYNLQTLSLSNNQLTSLPESIANLKDNLKTLILKDNPIPETEKARIRSWLPNTTITF